MAPARKRREPLNDLVPHCGEVPAHPLRRAVMPQDLGTRHGWLPGCGGAQKIRYESGTDLKVAVQDEQQGVLSQGGTRVNRGAESPVHWPAHNCRACTVRKGNRGAVIDDHQLQRPGAFLHLEGFDKANRRLGVSIVGNDDGDRRHGLFTHGPCRFRWNRKEQPSFPPAVCRVVGPPDETFRRGIYRPQQHLHFQHTTDRILMTMLLIFSFKS